MSFEDVDRTLLWEFGYWGKTMQRWYQEGLPRVHDLTQGSKPGEAGGIRGETGPHNELSTLTTGLRKRDIDVRQYFGFDKGMVLLPVNSFFSPPFEYTILEETEEYTIFQDEFGIRTKTLKQTTSTPQFLKRPVENRRDFEAIRERLKPVLKERVPAQWKELVQQYAQRDYPLTIGGHPCGFWAPLRLLMGEVRLMLNFYDDPQLVRDFMNYLADFWIQLWGEVLSEIKVDCCYFHEDMAYRTGPFISPEMFREFMLPPYQRLTAFLRDMGLRIFLVDNDGNLEKLISLFLEAGITGVYLVEVQAGNDIVSMRKKYPRLQILGGIDKMAIARGKEAIDKELDSKVPFVLRTGGYVPHIDHQTPPDVSWEDFKYYRSRLHEMILENGRR